jgi:hypothetical protein
MWRSIDEEQDRKHSEKSRQYVLAVNHADAVRFGRC